MLNTNEIAAAFTAIYDFVQYQMSIVNTLSADCKFLDDNAWLGDAASVGCGVMESYVTTGLQLANDVEEFYNELQDDYAAYQEKDDEIAQAFSSEEGG